jgi:hypothetical protein
MSVETGVTPYAVAAAVARIEDRGSEQIIISGGEITLKSEVYPIISSFSVIYKLFVEKKIELVDDGKRTAGDTGTS